MFEHLRHHSSLKVWKGIAFPYFFDGGIHKGYRGDNGGWNPGSIVDADTMVEVGANKRAVGLLDSYARHTSEEGIRLVFVKSPVYEPLMSKISNVDENDSIFEKIAEKY